MRKEEMEAVGKAISVIIDKCHSRVIIEPIEESLTCIGCKWEFELYAEECEECSRLRLDNYERIQE